MTTNVGSCLQCYRGAVELCETEGPQEQGLCLFYPCVLAMQCMGQTLCPKDAWKIRSKEATFGF